jgi:hypothetical protein
MELAISHLVVSYRGAPDFMFYVPANLSQIIAVIPFPYNAFCEDLAEQLLIRRLLPETGGIT